MIKLTEKVYIIMKAEKFRVKECIKMEEYKAVNGNMKAES